jgi:nucleotide-binding universal stress UspA family protein
LTDINPGIRQACQVKPFDLDHGPPSGWWYARRRGGAEQSPHLRSKALSYKSILVHAEPGSACARRVGIAVEIAGMFDATLIGVGAEAIFPIVGSAYATADSEIIKAVLGRVAADLPAAERNFRELTSASGRPVRWVYAEDYPDRVLSLHARAADLIVASRPERGDSATYVVTPADLIMQAGGPVLLVNQTGPDLLAQSIIVAWKDTRESRRALTDALPFLERAKQVIIVHVNEKTDVDANKTGLKEISERLTRRKICVNIDLISKCETSLGQTVQAAADRHGADLIVAGAYGHSRLREWALGGVTRDLIDFSSKFVLFSH